MTEIGVYTVLAAGVASAVFVAGGRPLWHVAIPGASAGLIILLLAIISRRAGRPVQADTVSTTGPSTGPEKNRPSPATGLEQTAALRKQYSRYDPYTRPMSNMRPSPNTEPVPTSRPIPSPHPTRAAESNAYAGHNANIPAVTDARPQPAESGTGETGRRGRRRRH